MGDLPDEPPGETPVADRSPDMDAGGHEPSTEDVDMEFVGDLEAHDFLGSLGPSVDDAVSELLLAQMGSSGRSYRRESAIAARRFVSEM